MHLLLVLTSNASKELLQGRRAENISRSSLRFTGRNVELIFNEPLQSIKKKEREKVSDQHNNVKQNQNWAGHDS